MHMNLPFALGCLGVCENARTLVNQGGGTFTVVKVISWGPGSSRRGPFLIQTETAILLSHSAVRSCGL